MNDIHLRREKRKQAKLEKLGTDKPTCPFCGETDFRCMEMHHVAGQARDPFVVMACANCHKKLSYEQRDHPASAANDDPLLDRIGHFFLGLADMLLLLVEQLREFGQALIDRARNGGAKNPAGAS